MHITYLNQTLFDLDYYAGVTRPYSYVDFNSNTIMIELLLHVMQFLPKSEIKSRNQAVLSTLRMLFTINNVACQYNSGHCVAWFGLLLWVIISIFLMCYSIIITYNMYLL